MGKGNFRPPTESTPLNRSPKNLSQVIRRQPLRLCQIRCISVHGGLLGIWVKYNQNYFYLYLFFKELTYRSDTATDFHAWWLKRRGLGQGCAFFGNFSHCSRFQAELAKSKNVHIFKITTSNPTKFCTVIKTTKCPSWVVPTHALQIQDGGRPQSWKNRKSPYFDRGSTDFHEIWHAGAVWHIMAHIGPLSQACYSGTFVRQFLCVNFAYANS